MKKKYICKYCKKEYSQEHHYKKHMAKYEEAEIVEVVETVEELVPLQRPVHQLVYEWFDALKGRRTANQFEMDRMVDWYSEIFGPDAPKPCKTCSHNHVFNTLKKLYDKHNNAKKDPCRQC